MFWLVLGCAPHPVSLPVAAMHHGPEADPPLLPLRAVSVRSVDSSCAAVTEGFEFAWTHHAGQHIHAETDIQLSIQNCGSALTEQVRLDPYRSHETGQTQLVAVLTGRGWATVFIEQEEEVLDVVRVETLQIERARWTAGGAYPWRESLTAAVQWALVEELEAALLPRPVLRAPRPSGDVLTALAAAGDGRSRPSERQAPQPADHELMIAQPEPDEEAEIPGADLERPSPPAADPQG